MLICRYGSNPNPFLGCPVFGAGEQGSGRAPQKDPWVQTGDTCALPDALPRNNQMSRPEIWQHVHTSLGRDTKAHLHIMDLPIGIRIEEQLLYNIFHVLK